ncbi:MAG: cytochrome c biogenesis protein ResB [Azoarcus sp.]|jgi:hypothetical protein|nr:cytochrome c biogenesis protein ResB [Azoarcus sp.]
MARKLWQPPWGFREGALFVAGIALVGFALQLTVGYFDFYVLHFPANIVALALLVALIATGARWGDAPLLRWFSGMSFAIALIVGLLVLAFYMELTPQAVRPPPPSAGWVARLGFASVTSSWPFVLLYATTLLALGIAVARRLRHATRHDFVFLCNHLGLWILLAAAGFGAADMQRVVMYVREGETEWRVYNKNEEAIQLPLAIELKDFRLEEYPPRLALIDRASNKPQPEARPDYVQIDPTRTRGKLGDWNLVVDEYLHEAVRIDGEFRPSPMPASTPAARVTATNALSGAVKSGWVSGGGNVAGFYAALDLDDKSFLAMTAPEPKRYSSDIVVYPKDGKSVAARLEVNKPLTVAGWTIYQFDYDKDAGKMSTYSAMELVRDPWLFPAQFGMALMALGALLLVWRGAGARRRTP